MSIPRRLATDAETLFISRAGADIEMSARIAVILERAGFRVILQQRDFTNKNFIEQMQTALASGVRVIALLSPAYLASDYCAAEWQSVLAEDPLNKRSRLILLRVADCKPPGLLRGLAYWDLVSVDAPALERLILDAVRRGTQPGVPLAATAVPTNLPHQMTAFVGREQLVAATAAAIDRAPLVTLLGPGGIGKTRVALEVARMHDLRFPDGVWFADFAPLSSAYVVHAIATVLGIREEHDKPLIESILARVASRRMLVILDNCEHVVAEARTLAVALMSACRELRLIVTSREALGLQGEVVLRVPALALPPVEEALTVATAQRYEGLRLFAARAEAADSRFALSDANVGTVADICRQLDGIALAIELAAARVRVLDVAQIAVRLTERFRLLTGGSKTALPRQQTLRALIDWSYDLLDETERRLFRRLSIFRGGWTLAAATAVCADADTDEFAMLDRLTLLVDQSLVGVDFVPEAERFRFLESTRVYALERMETSGEFEQLARRRTVFYREFAGDDRTAATPILARFDAIQAELENLREVLAWTLDANHDVEAGACIAFGLARFWSIRLPVEGQRWLQLAQSKPAAAADPLLLANLASAAAAMLPQGTFERLAATERALALARLAADARVLSRALYAHGMQLIPLLRLDEAEPLLLEALEHARGTGSALDEGRALSSLTSLAAERSDIPATRRLGGQATAIFEAIGAVDGATQVSMLLGQIEFAQGNHELAFDLMKRARSGHGELRNHRSAALAAIFLSLFSLDAGDHDGARTHARDAVALLQSDRHPFFLAEAIELLGHVATLAGDARRGARLVGYADAAFAKLAHRPSAPLQANTAGHVRLLTQLLGERTLAECMAEGARLTEDAALGEALAVSCDLTR